MKKIFLLALMTLFLVSSVLAVGPVKIQPNPAYDNNDLTCYANNYASGFEILWKVNGNLIGSGNPLSASKTVPGQTVECEAYALTPWGSQFVGDDAVRILGGTNHAPTVIILNPHDGEQFRPNQDVLFQASGTDQDGDSLTYLWDFGDGHSSTGSSLNHQYSSEGTYTAKVTVDDGHGGKAERLVTITISKYANNHAPTVTINYPQNNDKFVEGSPITFIAKASDPDGDALTYSWNFGDGTSGINAERPVHTYTKEGNYKVTLTVSDGKLSTTTSINLEVLNKYYKVTSIYTFTDEYQTQSNDFYRGNPLYAKFFVKEIATGKPSANLDIDAYIYNANTGSGRIYLKPFTGVADGRLIFKGQPLLVNDGSYYYDINSIPLDKSLLGKDVVFVIAFKDKNGGQTEKVVEIHNNPVELKDLPDVSVPLNGAATLNLDNYVSDKETPNSEIKWTVSGNKNIQVTIARTSRLETVATFTSSVPGAVESIVFTADDGDGSQAAKSLTATVEGQSNNNGHDPLDYSDDRQDKYAYEHSPSDKFEIAKIAPLYYKQSYEAGKSIPLVIELTNSGVPEDLELELYFDGNQVQNVIRNLHIDTSQNKYVQASLKIPADAKAGVHVLRVHALNSEDQQGKVSYWTFVVTK